MSPGTANHQIFIIILFLPAAIYLQSVVTIIHFNSKNHFIWRRKSFLEDLNLLVDQRNFNLNKNGEFTITQ